MLELRDGKVHNVGTQDYTFIVYAFEIWLCMLVDTCRYTPTIRADSAGMQMSGLEKSDEKKVMRSVNDICRL